MLRKIVFTLLVAVLVSTVTVGSVSAGQEKVTVCHKPGTPAEATLEIAAPALNAHLGHGDYEGACTGPQSDGCTALNAVVPDPQTDPYLYVFVVSDLDFFPGETIHVDMTVTASASSGVVAVAVVLDSSGSAIAGEPQVFAPGVQGTVSADYVVVAGDDADGAGAAAQVFEGEGFTVDAVNISCTPAS